MFGLLRLPLLLVIAFVVGVFYERGQQQTLCETSGHAWRDGVCVAQQ